jgi:hypothetical protein
MFAPPARCLRRNTGASSSGSPRRRLRRETTMPERIIPDRAEFIDVLNRLRAGHVLVKTGEGSGSCVVDGGVVYHSYPTLMNYGLIDEFRNPFGFAFARYFRLSPRGREFAERACSTWQQRPLLERMALRLVG